MSRCIVNVANGAWYPKGQDRLVRSLDKYGYGEARLTWRDELPPGARSHHDSPYEFKVRALEIARDAGHGPTLWADSSVEFIKSPDPIFEAIERDGCCFFHLGWNVGQWCTDEALPKLGVTREQGFGIKMTVATMFGLDLLSVTGNAVLEFLRGRANDGSFVGPWRFDGVKLTGDPRGVFGHRHDQTALSVIVDRLGLPVQEGDDVMFTYPPPRPELERVVALCVGPGGL